ncbi:hypothetical protein Hypma_005752 [Hypsizygus marmoreus]|uniref:Uncharacterized protein n=1 Tax=Hypsizygus marmoreus TaxID=39966 RepID=A0A369KGD1_HYPMA|nr:hypothetical protein Hypma_005752 [Hypsizygus marmoreus]
MAGVLGPLSSNLQWQLNVPASLTAAPAVLLEPAVLARRTNVTATTARTRSTRLAASVLVLALATSAGARARTNLATVECRTWLKLG